MVSLTERLRAAMTEARKRRDPARTLLLSTILSDIKNREFELHRDPSDDETAEVLRRGVKRRHEAAEQYAGAGRTDLAERELAEVRAAVREAMAAGARDMGAVMGQVMPRFKGRADGKLVNRVVREELAAAS